MDYSIHFIDTQTLSFATEKEKILSILPNERTHTILSIKDTEEQDRIVAGEIAFYQCLKDFSVDVNTIQMRRDEYGKPSLISHPNLIFSKSHSGNLGCCVMSNICNDSIKIGVDIEKIAFIKRKNEISKRFFSMPFYQTYQNDPTDETFCMIWTQLEALCKADGKGISMISHISSLPDILQTNIVSDFLGNQYFCSIYLGNLNY